MQNWQSINRFQQLIRKVRFATDIWQSFHRFQNDSTNFQRYVHVYDVAFCFFIVDFVVFIRNYGARNVSRMTSEEFRNFTDSYWIIRRHGFGPIFPLKLIFLSKQREISIHIFDGSVEDWTNSEPSFYQGNFAIKMSHKIGKRQIDYRTALVVINPYVYYRITDKYVLHKIMNRCASGRLVSLARDAYKKKATINLREKLHSSRTVTFPKENIQMRISETRPRTDRSTRKLWQIQRKGLKFEGAKRGVIAAKRGVTAGDPGCGSWCSDVGNGGMTWRGEDLRQNGGSPGAGHRLWGPLFGGRRHCGASLHLAYVYDVRASRIHTTFVNLCARAMLSNGCGGNYGSVREQNHSIFSFYLICIDGCRVKSLMILKIIPGSFQCQWENWNLLTSVFYILVLKKIFFIKIK